MKLYCTDPDHEDFETIVQDVYFGNIPFMTPRGSFVINGAERIVVSQLHRSPGVFFGQSFHSNGTKLYSARVIPFKGSWIEFTTDINNVMYAYIDRKKKLPVTTLLRAIGYESDRDILEIFNLADEFKVTKTGLKKVVGRKLAARVLKSWVDDFVDEDTGELVPIERNEVILERDIIIEKSHISEILDSGVETILLHKQNENSSDHALVYNTLQKDPTNSEVEAVRHIYRQLRSAEAPDDETARGIIEKLFFSDQRYSLGHVGRFRINRRLKKDISLDQMVLTNEDIVSIISQLISLVKSKVDVDDIDGDKVPVHSFSAYFVPNKDTTIYITEFASYHAGLFDSQWDKLKDGDKTAAKAKEILSQVNNALVTQSDSMLGFDPVRTPYASTKELDEEGVPAKLTSKHIYRFLLEGLTELANANHANSVDYAKAFYRDLSKDGKADGQGSIYDDQGNESTGQIILGELEKELGPDTYRKDLAEAYYRVATSYDVERKDALNQADHFAKANPIYADDNVFNQEGSSIDNTHLIFRFNQMNSSQKVVFGDGSNYTISGKIESKVTITDDKTTVKINEGTSLSFG